MENIQNESVVTEEETVSVDELSGQLKATESALHQKTVEYELFRRASQQGISGIDKIVPFLDFTKLNIDDEGTDNLNEVIGLLSSISTQQKTGPIGQSTNGGNQTKVKTSEALLEEAREKARQTGRPEDRAAFSTLKQKLFGGR